MQWKSPILLLAVFATFAVAAAEDKKEEDSATILLTKDNFDEERKTANFFVKFYAPWCGHCQRLAPTWDELAEMLNTKEGTRVKIGKVDCTQQNELCSSHEVTGYPTLKFFKLASEESVKFRGTRDLPTLTNFINEQLGEVPEQTEGGEDDAAVPREVAKSEQGLVELTEASFGKHVASGKHFVKFYAPWCGHCQRLAPTWDELAKSVEYDTTVTIAKIDCTQHRPICQDFEVKGYPTLLWIEDGKKVEKYAGPRTHEDLKAYVEKMAGQQQQEMKPEEEKSGDSDAEEKQNLVVTLNNESFEHGIEKGTTIVKFFAPWCGHCKRMAPTWEQLAAKFVGQAGVKIAKVDCTVAESKDLCSAQDVNGFPTLYIYRDGEKITEYDGNRSLEDLFDFVQKHSEAKHDEL